MGLEEIVEVLILSFPFLSQASALGEVRTLTPPAPSAVASSSLKVHQTAPLLLPTQDCAPSHARSHSSPAEGEAEPGFGKKGSHPLSFSSESIPVATMEPNMFHPFSWRPLPDSWSHTWEGDKLVAFAPDGFRLGYLMRRDYVLL